MMSISILLMLPFFLTGYSCTAPRTPHKPRVCKNVCLGTRFTCTTEKELDSIVLVFGNHWFVFSLVPISTSLWKLKLSIVERVGKNTIHIAFSHWFVRTLSTTTIFQMQFLISNPDELER